MSIDHSDSGPIPQILMLAEFLAKRPEDLVFVTEGPEDSIALREAGLASVARPEGGAWNAESLRPLRAREVVIVNPEPYGFRGEWCKRDARRISTVASSIRIFSPIEFQNLVNPPGNLAEWLARGNTGESFEQEARHAPEWEEDAEEDAKDLDDFLANPPIPRPICSKLLPVPTVSPELIPEPFRAWLLDIAERVGCSMEFPVIGAILAIACLIGRKIGIRPKRCDDWLVVPNLWGAIVGRPGVMKSPALEEALKPLHRLLYEARKVHGDSMGQYEAECLIVAAKSRAAKEALDKAAKKGSKVDDLDLRALALEAVASDKPSAPALRRYIVNDATIEKLVEIMAENPTGVLLYRDELTGFLRSLVKPGRESDRPAYLECWNGNGRITQDRIMRGTTNADGACLSILGGIQPGPLAAFIRGAAEEEGADDDGFIPRFQLLVYPDTPEVWKNVDRWPDTAAKTRAFEIFTRLDLLKPEEIDAEADGDGIPFLRFDPEAQKFFDEWRSDLENNKLRNEDESRLVEGHLSKYRSLMPSLALLFHLVEVADGKTIGSVSLHAARMAAAWCDFLEAHARRIYALSLHSDSGPAKELARHLKTGELKSPFRLREVVRKNWSGLSRSREVEMALGMLEDHRWLFAVEKPSGPDGGRPTVEYHINPIVIDERKGGAA